MATSILAENTITKKIESNVVNHSSENVNDLLTGIDKLLKQHDDEIAKQAPLYDIPRTIESAYDIPRSEPSIYAVPKPTKSHYDIPRSAESNYDMPKSLAKRPLPPLPVEPFMVNESIYEEISSFKSPKDSVSIKTSLHQAKVHLLEALQNFFNSLNKVFAAIRPNQSNDSIKIRQDIMDADQVINDKIAISFAELKFLMLGSSESLQNLINNLEKLVLVLEVKVANFSKVYTSEYGELLGAKLTFPMAKAKSDLAQAKARLTEVKGLEKELALTNPESTQAPVSTANNRFTLFAKTVNTSWKMEENSLYDSLDVVKGTTRSAG